MNRRVDHKMTRISHFCKARNLLTIERKRGVAQRQEGESLDSKTIETHDILEDENNRCRERFFYEMTALVNE